MAFSLKTLVSGMFSRVALNSNFQKIEDKVNDDLVHRQNGSAVMQQDLDMNSNEILNVNDPTSNGSVANKKYVDDRDAVLQANIDDEAATRASEDIRYNTLANEYANTAVNNALSSLKQELVEGDVKTVRYSVIASEGQTAFTVPFGGFKVAEVYINGVHQNNLEGAYTTNGSTFSFTEPLTQGDVLFFVLGIGYELENASNVTYEVLTATEGQSSFTLSSTPMAEEILVFVNGIKQVQNSYGINLDAIEFSTSLTEGDLVEVVRINRIQKETEYLAPVALFAKTISQDLIIPANFNGLSVNPTVAEGVTVTVPSGSTWAIVGN